MPYGGASISFWSELTPYVGAYGRKEGYGQVFTGIFSKNIDFFLKNPQNSLSLKVAIYSYSVVPTSAGETTNFIAI